MACEPVLLSTARLHDLSGDPARSARLIAETAASPPGRSRERMMKKHFCAPCGIAVAGRRSLQILLAEDTLADQRLIGMDAFVAKPVNARRLIALVERLAGSLQSG